MLDLAGAGLALGLASFCTLSTVLAGGVVAVMRGRGGNNDELKADEFGLSFCATTALFGMISSKTIVSRSSGTARRSSFRSSVNPVLSKVNHLFPEFVFV